MTPAVADALEDERGAGVRRAHRRRPRGGRLLTDDDPPLRLVAAVDVAGWEAATWDDDPTAVRLPHEVPLAPAGRGARRLARRRRRCRAGRGWRGDGRQDDAALEACLDHELGWFAAQEVDALLLGLGV